jgi:hypothetical protein
MSSRSELHAWIVIVLAMAAMYVYGSLLSRADLFGVEVFRTIAPWTYVACAAALFAAAGVLGAANPRRCIDHQAAAAVAAVLSWPVFYLLRTNWLNADGNMLTPRFEADVPQVGAHLTHDEMLELFLHSRFWKYTNQWWGWSVVYSYQVVSCAAGVVFVYASIRLARRVAPAAPWLFVAGVLAGGYMQLFFGDVENYTVTAALVALYALAACRFLAGEVHLALPAVMLAVAACFHMEAAWLWPSAVYLAVISRRRRGNATEATVSAAAAGAIVLATFVYFHFHGLPLMRFFSSHAGHALRMNGVFAVGMPLRYYVEQLNLLLLLCPAVAMGAALAAWRRFGRDEVTIFLGISAGSMLLLQVVWRSQLGILDDWNLYAMGGMLLSLFIWRGMANAARTPAMRVAAAALAATGWLHTYAWILMNHRHGN